MVEDLRKCCRICLGVESVHVSIIGDPTIHLQLKSCLSLTVSPKDDLPKNICVTCVSQLAQFYNFQLSARCSQDWLESSIEEKSKKSAETKTPIQPLPDSEYNSDSLLEFLNNTANIEEYLNNLGKEDIPSIVNLLDRNEKCIPSNGKSTKSVTYKKKENDCVKECDNSVQMEIDVLDSDREVVQEILLKEMEPKLKTHLNDIANSDFYCFACSMRCDNINKLSQHMSVCDAALRTCIHCNMLFDSKQKMQQHFLFHNLSSSVTCKCGEHFQDKDQVQHHKNCLAGCSYRCKECGKVFKERFLLYRHARTHIQKSEERICDVCGHSFVGNDSLTKHKKKEHEISDNLKYRCKVCNITSSDHKEIYQHVRNHVLKQEPSFHLCDSCGCNFSTRASLLRHMAKHEKKQILQCNMCFKNFTQEKLLNEHKLEHSDMIVCDRCGQTFNSINIKAHSCI